MHEENSKSLEGTKQYLSFKSFEALVSNFKAFYNIISVSN